MYVCSCNGYRDADLREVAREGISCAVEAYNALGNGPCCGNCLDCAQDIIDRARLEFTAGAPSAVDRATRDCRSA